MLYRLREHQPASDLTGFILFESAVMDIDTLGTFTMCHAAMKYLKQGGKGKGPTDGGVVINISATLHYSASWYQIHVSAAKVELLFSLTHLSCFFTWIYDDIFESLNMDGILSDLEFRNRLA